MLCRTSLDILAPVDLEFKALSLCSKFLMLLFEFCRELILDTTPTAVDLPIGMGIMSPISYRSKL